MRDIRILTLYKQHYLDNYKKTLKCQFSCLGYYDGINVRQVNDVDPKLYNKKSNSPISEIWYGLSESAETIDGRTSRQDIGIFRSLNTDDKEKVNRFWEKYRQMPFFAVAFLQLKKSNEYSNIARKIEGQFESMSSRRDKVQFDLKTYYTLDNADLVVVLQSNSMQKISSVVEEIKVMPEITYCHMILGISDKYLDKFGVPGKRWNGYPALLDEKIKRISMKVVTSGNDKMYGMLKQNMPDCKAASIVFSELNGHEDVLIEVNETTVNDLFKLLVPGGFSTHQNRLYGKYVYSIETSVILESKNGEDIAIEDAEPQRGAARSWFVEKIYKYREYQKKAWKNEDVALYSYYQALIRTLNLLVQFEKFEMSEDIFYLLFPAFELFEKQLDKAIDQEKNNPGNMETIKKCVCDFVDSVNSVIYHIIHTDQMFLMVPGYSGTSFAIPIKLCLFYSWFVRKLIYIMNDEMLNEYQCILVPTLGSRPMTSLIGLGLPPGSRLIKIDLSQRMLYMPRDLMIILSHEVAHYVGNDLRLRSIRLECIIKTLACMLAEGIIPTNKDETDEIEKEFENNRKSIETFMLYSLQSMLKSEKKDKYHASDIKVPLQESCKWLLFLESDSIRDEIFKISKGIRSKLSADDESYVAKMEKISQLQREYDNNRKEILASGIIDEIVETLVDVYCEVFSDVIAVKLLDVNKEFFEEAFRVSEGAKLKKTIEQTESVLRRELINHIFYGKSLQGNISNVRESNFKSCDRIVNNMFAFDATVQGLEMYANECVKMLDKYISSEPDRKDRVNEIRDVFGIFTGNKKSSCEEIYGLIQNKICEYEEDIAQMYKK